MVIKADLERILSHNLSKNEGYVAVADPRKYIQIDPRLVEYHCAYHMRTRRTHGSKLFDWGKIEGGEWDKELKDSLSVATLTEMLRERYEGGLKWKKTRLFAHKMKKIAEKGKIDGCLNEKELLARYERLDRLYDEMKRSRGLFSADERGAPVTDDLFISIGRDGGLLFSHGGSHRLSLAQILELPSIPVRVTMRHSKWQEKRDQAYLNYVTDNLSCSHPDMEEFQNGYDD